MEHLLLSCIESRVETQRSFYGRFQLGPFNLGQGLTVANALRRTLLSELEGLAVTAVDIEGATHEYSTLSGVRESVLDILLNIKQIILASNLQIHQPEIAYLQFKGPGIVRASHIKFPLFIQCVDPEQHIATLAHDANLTIKFIIFQGKNYFIQTSNSKIFNNKMKSINKNLLTKNLLSINYLPIDAIFMPVKKVNFVLETYTEKEQLKDRVILEIWTNGSIHPKQAIHHAAHILVRLFSSFQKTSTFKSVSLNHIKTDKKKFNLNIPPKIYNKNKNFLDKKLESLDIVNLDLSLRPYTCLKRANINIVADLLRYSSEELLLLKNFGKRSLQEVEKNLCQLGLNLKNNLRNETKVFYYKK